MSQRARTSGERTGGLFTKLPGFQRAPAGLEWALVRRLPAVALGGTGGLVLAAAAATWWSAPDVKAATAVQIVFFALLSLHWTTVLTGAIACAIVVVAKGPAYVADAYPVPDEEA